MCTEISYFKGTISKGILISNSRFFRFVIYTSLNSEYYFLSVHNIDATLDDSRHAASHEVKHFG